jgi:hypothetical protein
VIGRLTTGVSKDARFLVRGAKSRASVACLRFTADSICDSVGPWPNHTPMSMVGSR